MTFERRGSADGQGTRTCDLGSRGRPEGRHAEHWQMALSEFERENKAPNTAKVVGSPLVTGAPGKCPFCEKNRLATHSWPAALWGARRASVSNARLPLDFSNAISGEDSSFFRRHETREGLAD
jgi:hypothetical protein